MLPELPRALKFDFRADLSAEISQSGAACPMLAGPAQSGPVHHDALPVDHHCQICLTCGHRLTGHRCKLVCTNCGYYLSCADYY